jgi:hypothetical protein
LVSSENAYSQLSKVPLQSFGKIPAALCDGFPAKPLGTPCPFSMVHLCNWRVNSLNINL